MPLPSSLQEIYSHMVRPVPLSVVVLRKLPGAEDWVHSAVYPSEHFTKGHCVEFAKQVTDIEKARICSQFPEFIKAEFKYEMVPTISPN